MCRGSCVTRSTHRAARKMRERPATAEPVVTTSRHPARIAGSGEGNNYKEYHMFDTRIPYFLL